MVEVRVLDGSLSTVLAGTARRGENESVSTFDMFAQGERARSRVRRLRRRAGVGVQHAARGEWLEQVGAAFDEGKWPQRGAPADIQLRAARRVCIYARRVDRRRPVQTRMRLPVGQAVYTDRLDAGPSRGHGRHGERAAVREPTVVIVMTAPSPPTRQKGFEVRLVRVDFGNVTADENKKTLMKRKKVRMPSSGIEARKFRLSIACLVSRLRGASTRRNASPPLQSVR